VQTQTGYALIEIVIVLVIVGLLVGAVLKGQELVTGARVRHLVAMQEDVKAAYFGFFDRFRSRPGDYDRASTNIPCTPACTNGNNNGEIRSIADGEAIDEHIAVWEHLSKAGFIDGSYTYAAGVELPSSVPTNPYGRYLRLIYDGLYGAGTASAPNSPRHNLKMGNQIPSDILLEIDRKTDDGLPISGTFQFSSYDGGGSGGIAPTGLTGCYSSGPQVIWIATTSIPNCDAASLL
jgi:Tfp pilus assembly protein PilE